jgi:protein-disulfide isomerase
MASSRIENFVNVLMGVSAVVVTAVTLRSYSDRDARSVAVMRTERMANWRELVSEGRKIGAVKARLEVVEFMDYQCPFCKKWHDNVQTVLNESPGSISQTFLHVPIDGHKHAIRAARAAECAGRQGRFQEITAALFAQQDSIGIKSWEAFAESAGVPDVPAYSSCTASDSAASDAVRYRALADKHQVTGTPTIIINGLRYSSPPSLDTLRAILERAKE